MLLRQESTPYLKINYYILDKEIIPEYNFIKTYMNNQILIHLNKGEFWIKIIFCLLITNIEKAKNHLIFNCLVANW
jgi:hypothetical protein